MVVVGDVIVGIIIEKLVDVGFNYAADQLFARRRRMEDELKRLEDALPHIQAVVEAADQNGQREITGALNKWLWQLKNAVYMAQDVLDDLDYLRRENEVEMNAAGTRPDGSKVRGFIYYSKGKASKFVKRAFKSDPTLNKLRGAVKRLNDVAVGVKDFMSILKEQHHQTQIEASSNRETGPILRDSNVLGRDEERKKVLQWLTVMPDTDHKESISLFSIVGLGGVGKTTLAQLIYEELEKQPSTSSFDILLWACVSTPFDVKKIMGDILEYIEEEKHEFRVLARLEKALKAKVSSKKFLLVLDDAWDDGDLSSWETLFAPLRGGLKGSKILLTTRSQTVAERAAMALGGSVKKPVMRLQPLESDDFLSLFNRYAFAGVNPRDFKKLELVGEQIARRLGGLPLAAKTIGALLRSNLDESHWKNILQSSHISVHAQQKDDVMPVLMLSYCYLPTYLRPCFAFCSIFPQDYKFFKDDLVLMWMALGFIQQSPRNMAKTLEDIGSGYFDELAKLSFFEQYYIISPNPVTGRADNLYIMHDLLHDLACKVSRDECFRFVGGMSIDEISKMVRHLHFVTDDLDLLKNVDKWKNLHTLILEFDGYNDEHVVAFEQVFESLESIRVLSITVEGMKLMLDATGKLRHLRYLSIGHRSIARLPSSICKLYHLQALKFGERNNIDTASVLALNNLKYLRHLLPWRVPRVNIDGIGTLTSLQRLSFDAGAHKLSELKDLRELEELVIFGLKNDQHGEEVSLVQLDGKKRLHTLDLSWSDDNSDVAEEYEKVLDGLHPPDSLRQLIIEGCRGARPPYWMEQESLKNLEEIVLSDNTAWEHLPSLGKLPYLNKLELRSLTALKQIGFEGGFQQLEVLEIDDCPEVKALPPLPLGLKSLELENVDLHAVAPIDCFPLSSLESLELSHCGELDRLFQASLMQGALTSLSYLQLGGFNHITSFPSEEACRRLTSLKELGLSDLGELTSVEGLKALSHLSFLWIEGCPKLVQAAAAAASSSASIKGKEEEQVFTLTVDWLQIDDPLLLRIEPLRQLTSVGDLEIRDCRNLECEGDVNSWLLQNITALQVIDLSKYTAKFLPCSLQALSSLRGLSITEAYELQSLQQMPSSLQQLRIWGCSEALKERCRKDEGADWPNIKHIPDVYIEVQRN